MSGRLFLLVNLPAEGLVLAKHTAKVPGSRVDSVREDVQEVGYASSHLVRLTGFDRSAFNELLGEYLAQYPDAEVLHEDEANALWVLRNRVRSTHQAARGLQFLGRTQSDFGLWWTNVEGGQFQLRAETKVLDDAHQDVERLRGLYRKAGIPAEVRVSHLGPDEDSHARDLRNLRGRFPA